MIRTGRVRRGSLGVTIQPVTSDIAASLGLREVRGALVNSVTPGSAAERAGLRQGDVITAFNGAPVADTNGLRNRVAGTQPGTEVTLTVNREGREQQLRATLGELNTDFRAAATQGGGGSTEGGQLGIGVEPLTPERAAQLNLPAGTQGLLVREVDPTGPAADAGIRQGDVIVEINRQPVRSTADVRGALERAGGRPSLVLINRRGTTIFLTVRPRG